MEPQTYVACEPRPIISMTQVEALVLEKAQHYFASNEEPVPEPPRDNMYLSWMYHTAKLVTNRSCLVCHDHSPCSPLLWPLGNLNKFVAKPYEEEHLCPSICLLGAASKSLGQAWMQNVSDYCNPFCSIPFHNLAFFPVQEDPSRIFPLCVCSEWGQIPIGILSRQCSHTIPTAYPVITTCPLCDTAYDFSCTDSDQVHIQGLDGKTCVLHLISNNISTTSLVQRSHHDTFHNPSWLDYVMVSMVSISLTGPQTHVLPLTLGIIRWAFQRNIRPWARWEEDSQVFLCPEYKLFTIPLG